MGKTENFEHKNKFIPVRTWQSQTQEEIQHIKPSKLHLARMHILAMAPSSIQD